MSWFGYSTESNETSKSVDDFVKISKLGNIETMDIDSRDSKDSETSQLEVVHLDENSKADLGEPNIYGIENLCLEGGGVKGLAFCGALKILEERGILKDIKRFIGSSAGAISAGFLAVGFTYNECLDILKNTDFNDFKDDSWGYVRDAWRIYNSYGYCKGDALYEWYGKNLRQKTGNADITFKQIYERFGKILVVTGTCINTASTHYYNYQSNPNMAIRKAVRISLSIPIFFVPIQWGKHLLVDGGVLNNYPIWYFI